ncbi:SNF2 family N-terminal domain-containing protein [Mycena sp. CBHHK59/15]|nr:SNF2 family N-terminal domain-containing protein [Mycena sp. CBHHK59/15]
MPGHFAGDSAKDWSLDERNLETALGLLGGPFREPHEFDLGHVALAGYRNRLVVVSDVLQKRSGDTEWLLLLPELPDELDFESLGLTSADSHDIMAACHTLQETGRIAVNARLALVMIPPTAMHANHLPFRLHVQVTISILIPSIYEPFIRTRGRNNIEDSQRRLLHFLYPDPLRLPDFFEGVINIPFFYSVLCPASNLQSPAADRAMQPEALIPTLLPFQRRSLAWLLDREGKSVTPNGEIVRKTSGLDEFSFWQRIEEGNQTFYFNRLSGVVDSNVPDEPSALGAILAEEPGLGKTLEMISLFLLNPASPDRHPGVTRWDPEARVEVKAVKTTLIVTPPALLSQWVEELNTHAPSLKVLVYDGWSKVKVPITASDVEKERVKLLHAVSRGKGKANLSKRSAKSKGKARRKRNDEDEDEDDFPEEDEAGEGIEDIIDWCSYVHGFDVVITTYQTLRLDFNVARATPERPRREDVVYSNVERPRSPLILVEWNRVVMDEVQMVGGGNVEYSICFFIIPVVPRLASFAVSGTPARTQIADLMHVLKFLRVDHLIGSHRLWARLALPGFANQFSAFFRNIAIRTTKASVKDELTIPQQTRFLVGIQMGPVERHVYDQNLEAALMELGLDARGVAATENWEVDGTFLRSQLRRLRAICTHPQVGQLENNRLFKPGALKSMEQVLQAMCDNNWGAVADECKAKVQCLIRMAQLQQHGNDDRNRYQHSLETLLLAEKEATQLIKEIESAIAAHQANSSIQKEQSTEPTVDTEASNDKGKGKERPRSLSPLSAIDSEEEDDSHSPAAKEYRHKRQALKQRLRECRLILHRVKFLQGDTYHMLGASQSAAEDAAYREAETIRRGLLKTTEDEAIDAMNRLARDVTHKGLTRDALQIKEPYLEFDLKHAEFEEEANEIIARVLNVQSDLLWEWRTHMTELLTQKLSPGEEADGQEYQRTLDDQGEAETYLQNYTALLADRREGLLKERTLLAAHDAREKRLRHTKAAIKATADVQDDLAGIELQPEYQVLHNDLSTKRKNLLDELQGRAIKSVVVDMGSTVARMHKDDDPEKIALKRAIADLRKLIADQGSLLEKLDADLGLYRKAFNQRILYFRQLQEISDSVSDVVFENTVAHALQECATEQRDLAAKINTNRARQRYLDHLSKGNHDVGEDEDEKTCILCKCDFIRGFITQCAHVFCEDCMKAWVHKKQGRTCPVCRVPVDPDSLERFAVAEPVEAPIEVNHEPVPKSRREISYNMIDPQVFREIQTMPSFGDYGNKIQTLVRHLLYLRTSDVGAKSIVFSAWADSLFIVERALRENGISCLRIDQNRKGEPAVKRFKDDDDILVLLLHGERENAGLNVTCASRVFLLESVVHHAFEIQAIARIDRMGQTRSTEVYCYYAEDTVEKNILDLAARQGTSLYTKNNSVGSILNVSALAGDGEKKIVDSPAKKVQKGDFIFKIDDMLAILFPHMSEDLEYLLPADEDVFMADAPSAPRSSVHENAVAGPSRL